MSTIRERDGEFAGIPDMPPLTGPDSAQARAYDRRALLVAGDAMADMLDSLAVVADRRPAHRGKVVSHDLEEVHSPDEACPLCAALAAWKAATG